MTKKHTTILNWRKNEVVYVPETTKSARMTRFLVGTELMLSKRASLTSRVTAPTTAKNPRAEAKEHVEGLLPYRQI